MGNQNKASQSVVRNLDLRSISAEGEAGVLSLDLLHGTFSMDDALARPDRSPRSHLCHLFQI